MFSGDGGTAHARDINTSTTSPRFVDACHFAAEHGWTPTQHSLSAETELDLAAFPTAAAQFPIEPLQGWQYTFGSGGPPLRPMLDKGLRMGGGTDATSAGPLSPWLEPSYFTTGRNKAGDLINSRRSERVGGRLPLPEALGDQLGPLLLAPAVQHLEV